MYVLYITGDKESVLFAFSSQWGNGLDWQGKGVVAVIFSLGNRLLT